MNNNENKTNSVKLEIGDLFLMFAIAICVFIKATF